MFLFALVCLAIFLVEYFRGASGSPAQLNSCVWFFVSCVHFALVERVDALSWAAVGVMALGVFSFWLGARIAFGFRLNFSDFNREGKFSAAFVFLVFIFVIVGLVGTVSKALDYAPYHSGAAIFGSGGSWYGDLRENLILYHKGSFGFWGYFLNISYVVTVFFIISIRSRADCLLATFFFLISLGYAFIATGRTFLILLLVVSLTALLARGVIKFGSAIGFLLAATAAVFFISPLLSGRVGMSFIDYFLLYIGAGASNFDWGINGIFECCSYGEIVFRSIFAILSKAGFDFRVVDLIQPVADTRLGGNVYTVFMPYYRDFGVVGVVIFMTFIGCFHSYVDRLSRLGNPLAVLVNGILYYALLMQFFQDQYFSLLSQWVQMIFWMSLLLWIRPIRSASFQKG